MDEIEYSTVEEVSQVLLSNQTIRKLIKEGRLHATKLGHVYRIPKTDARIKTVPVKWKN